MTTREEQLHAIRRYMAYTEAPISSDAHAEGLLSALSPWLKQDQEPSPALSGTGSMTAEEALQLRLIKPQIEFLERSLTSTNASVIEFAKELVSLQKYVNDIESKQPSAGYLVSLENRISGLEQDQEPAPLPTLAEGKLFGEINALKKELLHLKEHVVSSNDAVINFGLRVSSLQDRVSSIEDRLRKLEQQP